MAQQRSSRRLSLLHRFSGRYREVPARDGLSRHREVLQRAPRQRTLHVLLRRHAHQRARRPRPQPLHRLGGAATIDNCYDDSTSRMCTPLREARRPTASRASRPLTVTITTTTTSSTSTSHFTHTEPQTLRLSTFGSLLNRSDADVFFKRKQQGDSAAAGPSKAVRGEASKSVVESQVAKGEASKPASKASQERSEPKATTPMARRTTMTSLPGSPTRRATATR